MAKTLSPVAAAEFVSRRLGRVVTPAELGCLSLRRGGPVIVLAESMARFPAGPLEAWLSRQPVGEDARPAVATPDLAESNNDKQHGSAPHGSGR